MCQFQVVVMGYTTFKRFSGLYFWSILVATISVIIYTLGVVVINFIPSSYTHLWIPSALITGGYLVLIPSEFLFIYSRYALSNGSREYVSNCVLFAVSICSNQVKDCHFLSNASSSQNTSLSSFQRLLCT